MAAKTISKPAASLWMPLWIGDWRGSKLVARMSLEQRGAFVTLLMSAWESGGGIDAENRSALYRECGAIAESEQRAIDFVVEHAFTKGRDGVYRNRRLSLEYEKAASRSDKAREAANIRWDCERGSGRNASAYANAYPDADAPGDARDHAPEMQDPPLTTHHSDTHNSPPTDDEGAGRLVASSSAVELIESAANVIGKTIDPAATAQRLRNSFPSLDLVAAIRQAIGKAEIEPPKTNADKYLHSYLAILDRDQFAIRQRGQPPSEQQPTKSAAELKAERERKFAEEQGWLEEDRAR